VVRARIGPELVGPSAQLSQVSARPSRRFERQSFSPPGHGMSGRRAEVGSASVHVTPDGRFPGTPCTNGPPSNDCHRPPRGAHWDRNRGSPSRGSSARESGGRRVIDSSRGSTWRSSLHRAPLIDTPVNRTGVASKIPSPTTTAASRASRPATTTRIDRSDRTRTRPRSSDGRRKTSP
jgi:hypothetical protein